MSASREKKKEEELLVWNTLSNEHTDMGTMAAIASGRAQSLVTLASPCGRRTVLAHARFVLE